MPYQLYSCRFNVPVLIHKNNTFLRSYVGTLGFSYDGIFKKKIFHPYRICPSYHMIDNVTRILTIYI
jgi:hypothetical protein